MINWPACLVSLRSRKPMGCCSLIQHRSNKRLISLIGIIKTWEWLINLPKAVWMKRDKMWLNCSPLLSQLSKTYESRVCDSIFIHIINHIHFIGFSEKRQILAPRYFCLKNSFCIVLSQRNFRVFFKTQYFEWFDDHFNAKRLIVLSPNFSSPNHSVGRIPSVETAKLCAIIKIKMKNTENIYFSADHVWLYYFSQFKFIDLYK